MNNVEMAREYGITEKEYEARLKTETGYENIDEKVNILRERLKENGQWEKMPYNVLKKHLSLARGFDRTTLAYKLAADDNIMIRAAKTKTFDPEASDVPKTVPFEYRYVKKEEKEAAGFDAVCYRHIVGPRLERLKTFFQDKELINTPNSILCLLNYLIAYGAGKKWLRYEALRVASLTGMSIDTVLSVTQELNKYKLLVSGQGLIRTVTPMNKTKTARRQVIHLCDSDESYDKLLAQMNSDAILVDSNSEEEHHSSKVVSMLHEDAVKRIAHGEGNSVMEEMKGKSFDNSMDFVKIYDTMVNSWKSKLIESVEEYIKKKTEEYETRQEESLHTIERMQGEQMALKAELENTREKQKEAEKRADLYKNANNAFLGNAEEVLNVFVGRFMGILTDISSKHRFELRDERVVGAYQRQAFDLLNDTVKAIMEFKSDGNVVPNLIRE